MTNRPTLILASFLAFACSARAQVVFTMTGTANQTKFGYTTNQSYTFVFTTGVSFVTGTSLFTTSYNRWYEERTSDSQLWSSITGTGVTGDFVRPVAQSTDPYSFLRTTDSGASDQLDLRVDAEGTADVNIGLRGPDNTTALGYVAAQLYPTNFAFPGTESQPTSYFSSYLGTYSLSSGSITVGRSADQYDVASFTPTSVTIAAVPEPSTHAALAGLAALAGAIGLRLRNRRRIDSMNS